MITKLLITLNFNYFLISKSIKLHFRSAAAYLLVYDVSAPSTFNFIKMLRDQVWFGSEWGSEAVFLVVNDPRA